MSRARNVAVAVATVAVVGGLVALAAPAVSDVVGATGGAGTAADGSATPIESRPPPAATAEATLDIPEGYVDIGDGILVPPGGPGDCAATAYIVLVGHSETADGTPIVHPRLAGAFVDMGSREFAEGDVGYDDEGTIVSYTVAPGDAVDAIGDRLCAEGLTILQFNHVVGRAIQPGEVLDLAPDPSQVWEYEPAQ